MSKSSPQRTRKIWQPLNWQSQLLATLGVLAMSHAYSFQFNPSALQKAEQTCTTANCQTRSPAQETLKHLSGD